ncbi:hypothetical protein chiPu_0032027, partial [Chiloscyllium punctatum]|nr:hypothetical protein [Chiloscyllium punctatum]
MPIEVEWKFALREDTETRLRELGAVPEGSVRVRDRYYDTADLRLTAADLWLRSRDGVWELKSPAPSPSPSPSLAPLPGTTQYRESVSEAEILSLLLPALGYPDTARIGGLEELLRPSAGDGEDEEEGVEGVGLREFACIVTQRASYSLPGGARAVLDLTDFGHRLGEVEVMVDTEGELPVAHAQIQEIATKLG